MITSLSRILAPTPPADPVVGRRMEPAAETGPTKFSNQARAARNRYPQRSRNVLSRAQKAALCIKSRQAFAHLHGRPPVNTAEADAFRHVQVKAACGKPGLTAVTQDDYKLIEAWFHHLMGEQADARRADEAWATEPARVAMVKLQQALASKGLHLGYAAAICRSQYKCELAAATAQQLWRLVFTVKNRKANPKPKKVTYSKASKPTNPDNEPF